MPVRVSRVVTVMGVKDISSRSPDARRLLAATIFFTRKHPYVLRALSLERRAI
jgi:hypothetical protein